MKISRILAGLSVAALVAGCASFDSLKPGSSMAEVEQQFRAPGAKRIEANGNQVWEYNLGPEGRAFWALTFGPDGKLVQAKQALTEDNFRNLRTGQTTREDVLRLIGQPVRKFSFTRTNDEVWDYRYQAGTWAMLLSVHFDSRKGTVTSYFTQLDPDKYVANDTGT